MASPRHLVLSNFQFLVASVHITIPNFIKMSQMAAEFLHLAVFKMVINPRPGFLKFEFLNS